jgi:hypothetical protein
MCYSPRPIEEYSRFAHGVGIGPAYSGVLRADPEAWNLAWLSHPFEHSPNHPDPNFTVLVGKSLTPQLRALLKLPAGAFWDAASVTGLLAKTPLYGAYGKAWVDTVFDRAVARANEPGEPPYPDADRELERFKGAHI